MKQGTACFGVSASVDNVPATNLQQAEDDITTQPCQGDELVRIAHSSLPSMNRQPRCRQGLATRRHRADVSLARPGERP